MNFNNEYQPIVEKVTLKLFLIILFLGITFVSFSQQWDRVYNDTRFTKRFDVKPTNDNGIVFCGDIHNFGCVFPILLKYDSLGNIQWQKEGYGLGADAVFVTQNNDFLFTGYSWNDYDIAGDVYLILSKTNYNGDYIFRDSILTFTNEEYESIVYPEGVLQFQNGDILIYSVNRLIKTDSIGNLLWDRDFSNVDSIKYLDIISNNQFLISNSENLYKTNENGIILDSMVLFQSEILLSNDTIFVENQNKIIRFDLNFDIIDTIDVSNNFSSIHQIIKQDSTFWIKGISLDDSSIFVNQLSNTFQSLNTYNVPIQKIDTNAILCVTTNKLFFVSERMEQCAVSCFDQNLFSIDNSTLDISPENLSIDNIELEYYIEDSILIGFRFDAHVTIVNNGNDTINSLALYSRQIGYYNCESNERYQKFTNLNLPPNQSIDLDFIDIYEMASNSDFFYNYCLTCLAPNSKIETDISNNTICEDFFITDIENIKEINSSVNFFPNPFTDKIYINFNKEMFDKSDCAIFELADLTGKKVISQSIDLKNQQINIQNLKRGVYIGTLQTKTSIYTQKMIRF